MRYDRHHRAVKLSTPREVPGLVQVHPNGTAAEGRLFNQDSP